MSSRHLLVLSGVAVFVLGVLLLLYLSESPLPDTAKPEAIATAALNDRAEAIPPASPSSGDRPSRAPDDPSTKEAPDGATLIFGIVTNPGGHPVERVRLTPKRPGRQRVPNFYTDDRGRYEVAIGGDSEPVDYTILFEADGYEAAELRIPASALQGGGQQHDVKLSFLGDRAPVSGRVVSQNGDGIASAKVQLGSAHLESRYVAKTDRFGAFELPEVEPGSDYLLIIRPETGYEDYTERGVVVSSEGLEIEVVLDDLHAGRVTGHLVGPGGEPIPGMPLLIRSNRSASNAIETRTDAGGYFLVDDVPAGQLSFSSISGPSLHLRGVSLQPGEVKDVTLVFDSGEETVVGRVVDDRGDPVARAKVLLSWQELDGTVRSGSIRSTVTDADGSFRFDQIGSGVHRVSASANGRESAEVEYDVGRSGSTVELRLSRDSR